MIVQSMVSEIEFKGLMALPTLATHPAWSATTSDPTVPRMTIPVVYYFQFFYNSDFMEGFSVAMTRRRTTSDCGWCTLQTRDRVRKSPSPSLSVFYNHGTSFVAAYDSRATFKGTGLDGHTTGRPAKELRLTDWNCSAAARAGDKEKMWTNERGLVLAQRYMQT